jgi:hypothetical protein
LFQKKDLKIKMFNKSIESTSSPPAGRKGLREVLHGSKYATLPLNAENMTHIKNP